MRTERVDFDPGLLVGSSEFKELHKKLTLLGERMGDLLSYLVDQNTDCEPVQRNPEDASGPKLPKGSYILGIAGVSCHRCFKTEYLATRVALYSLLVVAGEEEEMEKLKHVLLFQPDDQEKELEDIRRGRGYAAILDERGSRVVDMQNELLASSKI